ncbi:branched-chain amino acid ABC transporter permease [Microvirga antarctica]|uniref:branched-chain amino acid ABC transporter permease n=1 Tax=Microvirga antarctica TaxID=2819233 RepID=UPI001B30D904|nr:branched-chain amino acid ABC transporter permease [Microvirga antarctica]
MDLASIAEMLAQGLPQAIVSGLVYGSIYALVAQGYYVTFSTTDTLNFAQGDFLMIAAMLSFTVLGGLALSGVSLWLALLAAIAVVVVVLALMGIAVERIAIRPLRGIFSFGWILSTVGVAVILRQMAEIIWGREHMRVPSVFGDVPIRLNLGTVQIGILPQEVFILAASLGAMIAVLFFLKKSRLGKAMAAVAFNAPAAALMGINVRHIVVLSYALSSVLAGLAGVLVAPVLFAHAHMGTLPGLKAFAVGIIGGLGNPVGILVVGLALGIVEFVVAIFNASLRDAVTFLILIAILAWRPMGLFDKSGREKV